MEIAVLASLTISLFFTVLGSLSQTSKRTIIFLALQAASIGFVELMYCLINLIIGLHMEALIDFLAAFIEWFTCAVVTPLIIYWGIMRTEDIFEQPIVDGKGVIAISAISTILCLIIRELSSSVILKSLETLPFVVFMFASSCILMVYRKDPLKILAGLNMAENAFYPLLAESPLNLIPFMLALMVFVNIVGVFITIEAYREYGTTLISKWRWIE
jgi:hypothetical protein